MDVILVGFGGVIEVYCEDYVVYYDCCWYDDSLFLWDLNVVVYLVLGVGMIIFVKDKVMVCILVEFYINVINVMCGVVSVFIYCGLLE